MIRRIAAATATITILTAGLLGATTQANAAPAPGKQGVKIGNKICHFPGGCRTYR